MTITRWLLILCSLAFLIGCGSEDDYLKFEKCLGLALKEQNKIITDQEAADLCNP
jgi:hypothetical protein